jgi:hypothetical protein
MASKAAVTFTKHGLRRHYENPAMGDSNYPMTLCWRPSVPLASRSRFFRRRLAQASFCGRCEQAEEMLQ